MPPPPTVMMRPSGSELSPPHDGLANVSGMFVWAFVVGSNRYSRLLGWLLSPHTKTLPSGSKFPCIAMVPKVVRLPH